MKTVFGIIVVLVILISPAINTAFAQDVPSTESANISDEATPSATYTLPYPGILPDNPLYFLKAIRDRIIGFLINDTLKKAEFSLLTSDKRLFASQLLMEKDKQDLAITTLSKSNNYLNEALVNAREAARQGKNVDTVVSNIGKSILMREKLFASFTQDVNEEYQDRLGVERERLESFKKMSNELSSE